MIVYDGFALRVKTENLPPEALSRLWYKRCPRCIGGFRSQGAKYCDACGSKLEVAESEQCTVSTEFIQQHGVGKHFIVQQEIGGILLLFKDWLYYSRGYRSVVSHRYLNDIGPPSIVTTDDFISFKESIAKHEHIRHVSRTVGDYEVVRVVVPVLGQHDPVQGSVSPKFIVKGDDLWVLEGEFLFYMKLVSDNDCMAGNDYHINYHRRYNLQSTPLDVIPEYVLRVLELKE